MDFLKNVTGDKDAAQKPQTEQQQQTTNQAAGSGGFMDKLSGFTGGEQKPATGNQESSSGGFMDKLNSMAGGGKESEKNEDALDKGIDWVQENVMGQGQQSNESAIEQAKDKQIAGFIRDQYKTTTGSDFPIKEKET
ncbi:hypothetical protein PspLS_04059 [Pyricularia sp. CBS 133598]|nr:hypothetical protein PspLS_04059 [Pyricularia sp. CBS 133598]